MRAGLAAGLLVGEPAAQRPQVEVLDPVDPSRWRGRAARRRRRGRRGPCAGTGRARGPGAARSRRAARRAISVVPVSFQVRLAALLGEYERHLVSERNLSPHTVRAYLREPRLAADHSHRLRMDRTSRTSTCARCAAGSPTSRPGQVPQHDGPPGDRGPGVHRLARPHRADPAGRRAPAWGQPKAHRPCPPCCGPTRPPLLEAAIELADDGSPVAVRDIAILELLYATGVRVGELVGLDVDDLDRERQVVRVSARAARSGACLRARRPRGAVDPGCATGRPAQLAPGSGGALFLGTRGRRIDQRAVRTLVHRRIAEVPGRSRPRSPRAAPHRRHPPARRRRRPALGPGAARPRLARDDPALHPRHQGPAALGLPAGSPPRLTKLRRARRDRSRSGSQSTYGVDSGARASAR